MSFGRLKNTYNGEELDLLICGPTPENHQYNYAVTPRNAKPSPVVAFRGGGSHSRTVTSKFHKDIDTKVEFSKVEKFLGEIDLAILEKKEAPVMEFTHGTKIDLGYIEHWALHADHFDDRGDVDGFTLELNLILVVDDNENRAVPKGGIQPRNSLSPPAKIKKEPKTREEKKALIRDWHSQYSKYDHKPYHTKWHAETTNLDKPVKVTTLPKGKDIVSYERIGGVSGAYAAYPGTSPQGLGIEPKGRIKRKYRLTEEMDVLESTAADVSPGFNIEGVGGKGGSLQLTLPPDWKKKVVVME